MLTNEAIIVPEMRTKYNYNGIAMVSLSRQNTFSVAVIASEMKWNEAICLRVGNACAL